MDVANEISDAIATPVGGGLEDVRGMICGTQWLAPWDV